jgi:hypothetical protein
MGAYSFSLPVWSCFVKPSPLQAPPPDAPQIYGEIHQVERLLPTVPDRGAALYRMRVLIVDDEPLARRGVRNRLKQHSDIEIVAECGPAAIAAIQESVSEFGVLGRSNA